MEMTLNILKLILHIPLIILYISLCIIWQNTLKLHIYWRFGPLHSSCESLPEVWVTSLISIQLRNRFIGGFNRVTYGWPLEFQEKINKGRDYIPILLKMVYCNDVLLEEVIVRDLQTKLVRYFCEILCYLQRADFPVVIMRLARTQYWIMYFNEQQCWAVMARDLKRYWLLSRGNWYAIGYFISELSCDWTEFRCSDACPKLRDKPQMTRSLAHDSFPVKLQDHIPIRNERRSDPSSKPRFKPAIRTRASMFMHIGQTDSYPRHEVKWNGLPFRISR